MNESRRIIYAFAYDKYDDSDGETFNMTFY